MTPLHYRFDTGFTASNPGRGRLRICAPDPSRAQELAICAVDEDGRNQLRLLQQVRENDVIRIETRSHAPATLLFSVIGRPVDNANVVLFPIRMELHDGDFRGEAPLHVLFELAQREPHDMPIITEPTAMTDAVDDTALRAEVAALRNQLAEADRKLTAMRDVIRTYLIDDPRPITVHDGD